MTSLLRDAGALAGLPQDPRWAERTGSTNEDLASLARAGAPHGSAVVAGQQRGGRGRRGRRWENPPEGALLLSVLLRGPFPPARLTHLALSAAVATAEACGPDYRIKWPNDVQRADGRKVAGVLAEVEFEAGQVAWAVVGVGLNLGAAPPDLPDAAGLGLFPLTDAVRAARAVGLVAGLLRWGAAALEAPEVVVAAWSRRDALRDRRVSVEGVEGIALGVDRDGALRLLTAEGERRVLAGDVSLISPAPGG
ncbi:MAG: biotin--[acetyl-CoA-carboxylase] ligase [Deltaproteobacteria bacterium]|nr:biotin--[acetyl-CoA-carboxylase] ligase [Deltaproteobacteria bacterium]